MASESKRTVLVALGANGVIALAKLAAGLVSGSSSMLAEAAHSVADTLNQVFLLTSLKVSARPADRDHPFGYGKAQFFWSFLAAVGIFVAGAVFSVYEGIHTLVSDSEEEVGLLIPYAVLGVSLAAEGVSWVRAVVQLRGESREAGRSLFGHVRASKDPTAKTVLSEDTAALLGILLAAAGIGLHYVTGSAVWDGAAAIAIGLLLAAVAFVLGRDTRDLLIGEAADPGLVVGVHDAISAYPEVTGVVELLTMHLGPSSVLVALRVDLHDGLSAAQVEEWSERAERDLCARWPDIRQLFLDPTRPDPERTERTKRHVDRLRGERTQGEAAQGEAAQSHAAQSRAAQIRAARAR